MAMNDATYLLMRAHREASAGLALLDSLVKASAETEVLRAEEVKPCIDKANAHLRNASAAATGLAQMAAGITSPAREV